jgi:hypothetical protein
MKRNLRLNMIVFVPEARGRDQASVQEAPRPKRQTRSTKHEDYVYSSFAVLMDRIMDTECFLSPQMSAKAGLKMFGEKGATAIMKELGQLVLMDVIKGCFAHQMTREQKHKALRYLMFLKGNDVGASRVEAVLMVVNNDYTRLRRKRPHLQSALKLCF